MRFHGSVALINSLPGSFEPDLSRLRMQGPNGLNVSPNAVRSWEQGTRRPRQAALKLLVIAKKNPKALLVA